MNFDRKCVAIYKPNKKKSGGAAQFQLSGREDSIYLEMARQVDEIDSDRPYDWNTKVVVKLGIPDITKMLAYFKLNGPQVPLKLFHKNDKGSKAIELKWQSNYSTYYLSVSSKEGDEVNRIGIPIGLDEVELLVVAFRRALEIILKW